MHWIPAIAIGIFVFIQAMESADLATAVSGFVVVLAATATVDMLER